jgi:hypothetical protein|eukprot:TRINITY_DN101168_c0_g1_i1.p1 TRINITY_DN101168_c0_g1~~TRINITY_DN101168_c0_g1_i1.p1  ORF type:complete len:134 (-),score=8.37 TRINITY_DN101168_c0_g1_i1:204-605(-)
MRFALAKDLVNDHDKCVNTTKIPFGWQDSRDTRSYRAGLIAHQEAVLNAALNTPAGTPEHDDLVRKYRFLNDYRVATEYYHSPDKNTGARDYCLQKYGPLVSEQDAPMWRRFNEAPFKFRTMLSNFLSKTYNY